ncbi:hypothetical protein MiYa_00943 [Microcystis aeruginosa NIES-2519]|uniref:DUF3352 domain-containing protein n=1 Tax=Microcystis aeruginosa NIES-2519 TaxID=2303981 RepID=A0A5A5R883_MICAE|nr:DUF3352 domain-containing protein [Microcystis aeruginosa]GCA69417.1 hypothetical protein MiYa_00943 [Microcystis aeruginosa NIES-2519]
MSKKSFLPGCLVVLGLTAVTSGGVYLYLRGQLPWQRFTPLQSAKVIPETAFASSFVSTDAKAWSVLAKYGTPESRTAVSQGLEELQKNIFTDKIDYQRDIEPWIGSISFAFLPAATPGQSELLTVIGIKDKIKASEFQKKLGQQVNRKTSTSDYKGVKITAIDWQDNTTIYTAVTGDFLLISYDKKVLEAAINTYQGQPSFSSKPEVRKLLSQSLNLPNTLATIYIDDYAAILGPDANLSPQSRQELAKIQDIVAGVGVTDTGLQLQMVAKLAPETISNLPSPSKNKVLNYFPGDTIALWSGNNLKQGWEEAEKQSQTNPELQAYLRQIRENFQMATLDADKEVFNWMDREFAFGIIPNQQAVGGLGFGGMMIWQTGDQKAAKITLDKLNELVKTVPFITIKNSQISGQDVTEWKAEEQALLTYAWANNDTLKMTVGIPYQPQPNQPISKSENFQASIANLPKNNLGYFFIDVEQIIAKAGGINNLPATELTPEAKAFLESVRGIGITATMPDKTTSKIDVLFSLKQTP